MTGLINRSEFEKRIERVLETARKSRDEHALCYLDLDQFKVVNDTCGHMAGDEFGVLMEHCTLEQARRLADDMRTAVAEFRFAWEDTFHR